VKSASIIIQTHYHGDHFTLGINRPYEFTNEEIQHKIYGNSDKTVLAKDQKKKINYNQKKRAYWLWKKEITIHSADNKEFLFGKTKITFSQALPHGVKGSKSGWVISAFIEDTQDTLLYSSDVQGPGNDLALEFIIDNNANHLIIDGPSTYHPKQTQEETEAAFNRIRQIPKDFFFDHHFLRDKNWLTILKEKELDRKAHPLSDLVLKDALCFESVRDDLHTNQPMDEDFDTTFKEMGHLNVIREIAGTLPFSKIKKQL
jgi:predicted metallo-beta-lactamase superfamily hydrolase